MAGSDGRPFVLMVGVGEDLDPLWNNLRVVRASTDHDAAECLQDCFSVVILGPRLNRIAAQRIVHSYATRELNLRPRLIVSGVDLDPQDLEFCVDEDLMFYFSRAPMGWRELYSLAVAASGLLRLPPADNVWMEEVFGPEVFLTFLKRLCLQEEVEAAGRLLAQVTTEILAADGGECFLFNQREHLLLSLNPYSEERRRASAAAGVVAYAARTGERVVSTPVGRDGRFDPDTDLPTNDVYAHLVAEPVVGNAGKVLAILTVARSAVRPAFSSNDLRAMRQFATCAAPVLEALLLQRSFQEQLVKHTLPGRASPIYREEALAYRDESGELYAPMLNRSTKVWRLATWLLPLVTLVLLAIAMRVEVSEYAIGSGIVTPRRTTIVRASEGGRIMSHNAAVGSSLRFGQLISCLDTLSGASACVAAPESGVVGSLAPRGDVVAAGQRVATIVDVAAGFDFVAQFPAATARRIATGDTMFIQLDGSDRSRQALPVDSVELPTSGRNDESDKQGGTATGTAGVVVARSRLPDELSVPAWRPDGQSIGGRAEIRIGSQSLIATARDAIERHWSSRAP